MFKINNIPINVNKFPDGTQCIMDFNEFIIYTNYENIAPYYEIVWLYESDEEVFTLMCLVNHIRDNHKYSNNLTINLILSYGFYNIL